MRFCASLLSVLLLLASAKAMQAPEGTFQIYLDAYRMTLGYDQLAADFVRMEEPDAFSFIHGIRTHSFVYHKKQRRIYNLASQKCLTYETAHHEDPIAVLEKCHDRKDFRWILSDDGLIVSEGETGCLTVLEDFPYSLALFQCDLYNENQIFQFLEKEDAQVDEGDEESSEPDENQFDLFSGDAFMVKSTVNGLYWDYDPDDVDKIIMVGEELEVIDINAGEEVDFNVGFNVGNETTDTAVDLGLEEIWNNASDSIDNNAEAENVPDLDFSSIRGGSGRRHMQESKPQDHHAALLDINQKIQADHGRIAITGQVFRYVPHFKRIYNEKAKRCLTYDIHSAKPAALLLPCMSRPSFKWTIDDKGRLYSDFHKTCLTMQDKQPHHLVLNTCREDEPRQQFEFFAPPMLQVEKTLELGNNTRRGGGFGDPHIETFGGELFSFHGGCDLVLLTNPGLDMHLHIRTVIRTWWSFIHTAAIRIGKDVLEVQGGKEQNLYWINGKAGRELQHGETLKETLNGNPIHFRWTSGGQRQFRVDLGDGDAIFFKTFGEFLRVNVKAETASKFQSSLGLMGNYEGLKLARDKKTMMEDTNKFGLEWQVLPKEPRLFHQYKRVKRRRGKQKQCEMPRVKMPGNVRLERRLEESGLSLEEAEQACAGVEEATRSLCVEDVLVTGTLEIAGSY